MKKYSEIEIEIVAIDEDIITKSINLDSNELPGDDNWG